MICKAVQVILRVQWGQDPCFRVQGGPLGGPGGPRGSSGVSRGSHGAIEEVIQEVLADLKIPSEMGVAPRYTLHCFHCFHCLHCFTYYLNCFTLARMPMHIVKRFERCWYLRQMDCCCCWMYIVGGSMGFRAKC